MYNYLSIINSVFPYITFSKRLTKPKHNLIANVHIIIEDKECLTIYGNRYPNVIVITKARIYKYRYIVFYKIQIKMYLEISTILFILKKVVFFYDLTKFKNNEYFRTY